MSIKEMQREICTNEKGIIISDSTGLLMDLESYFKIQRFTRAHVVNIGHIQEFCSVTEANKTLIYFGPLRWRKGADILPDLLSKIVEKFPDWTLQTINFL